MDAILLLLLALVWLIACWLRIVRQAQFFQIEEYDSRRYLRWALRNGEKRAPARPLGLWFIDLAGVLVLWLLLGSILPHLILITAAALSGWRQLRFQAKKPLVLTGRVKRLLGVSFICCAISLGMGALYLRSDAANLTPDVQLIFTHGLGLIALMLGPLWLVLGNLLLQPVEGFMRRRFLRSARAILERIDPKIIGITGSYGKTTTKHFLREILSLRSHVYATPKSYNTLMGISLAINRDLAGDFRSEYFISEMGAYAPGEIARICQLTPPDIAIVTEIGPQHLERFGSLDNIKRAKYEIIKNLPPDGVALFNWDNPYIRDMIAQGWPATILSVSRELDREAARAAGITWIAADIQESLAGLRFTVVHVATGESAAIKAAINGEHNVTNLLLCIAVAHYEGIPLRDISRAHPGAATGREPLGPPGQRGRHHHHQRCLQRQPQRRRQRAKSPGFASRRQTPFDHARHGRAGRPA